MTHSHAILALAALGLLYFTFTAYALIRIHLRRKGDKL